MEIEREARRRSSRQMIDTQLARAGRIARPKLRVARSAARLTPGASSSATSGSDQRTLGDATGVAEQSVSRGGRLPDGAVRALAEVLLTCSPTWSRRRRRNRPQIRPSGWNASPRSRRSTTHRRPRTRSARNLSTSSRAMAGGARKTIWRGGLPTSSGAISKHGGARHDHSRGRERER